MYAYKIARVFLIHNLILKYDLIIFVFKCFKNLKINRLVFLFWTDVVLVGRMILPYSFRFSVTNVLPSKPTAGPLTASLNKKTNANSDKPKDRRFYPRDENRKIIRPTFTTSGQNKKTHFFKLK
jgi:hypothetical protein